MLDALIRLFWPPGLQEKLGRTLAALSAYALITRAFTDGTGPVYRVLLDYYEKLVNVLIGWGKPWIEVALGHVGLKLGLYPQWNMSSCSWESISGVTRSLAMLPVIA